MLGRDFSMHVGREVGFLGGHFRVLDRWVRLESLRRTATCMLGESFKLGGVKALIRSGGKHNDTSQCLFKHIS